MNKVNYLTNMLNSYRKQIGEKDSQKGALVKVLLPARILRERIHRTVKNVNIEISGAEKIQIGARGVNTKNYTY